MDAMGITKIAANVQSVADSKSSIKRDDAVNSFADMLQGAVEKVNTMQNAADQAVQDLLTGREQNIHQVMIAVEKANLSFQMMMQVRNKLISAYEEIMRTQV